MILLEINWIDRLKLSSKALFYNTVNVTTAPVLINL